MDMKETYMNLIKLQDILSEKFKIEEKMDELPMMLTTRIEVLNRVKKSYLKKHTQFKELEERIFEHQRLMGEISLRQTTLQDKAKNFKTQKEYESLDKELNYAKQKEEEYRFQLLQDQRVIDDLRGALEKDEESIQQQENEIRLEQDRINQEIESLKEKGREFVEEENRLMQDMDDDIKYKFARIVKNKDGIGIVAISTRETETKRKASDKTNVKNSIGFCTGCNFVLPPQFINNVRVNEKLQYCPNCSRILYFQDAIDEDVYSIEDGFKGDDDEFFNID